MILLSQFRLTDHFYGRYGVHSLSNFDELLHAYVRWFLANFSAQKAEQLLGLCPSKGCLLCLGSLAGVYGRDLAPENTLDLQDQSRDAQVLGRWCHPSSPTLLDTDHCQGLELPIRPQAPLVWAQDVLEPAALARAPYPFPLSRLDVHLRPPLYL